MSRYLTLVIIFFIGTVIANSVLNNLFFISEASFETYSKNIEKNKLTNYKDGDRETIIAFEGKIYNAKELKKELKNNGYKFLTNSDEEIILKAFDFWQEDAFEKLNDDVVPFLEKIANLADDGKSIKEVSLC